MNLYKIIFIFTLISASFILANTSLTAQNIYPPETNRSVFMDGGDIQLIIPDENGWWTKGLFNVDADSLKIMGGFGVHGLGTELQRYFMNFGRRPWSDSGGISLLPNGNFGIGKSLPQATLDVKGSASFEKSITVGGYHHPDYQGIVIDHGENTTWQFLEFKNENGTVLKIDADGNMEAANAKFCEVLVNEDWCDFVFEETYELPSLIEEKKHIEENGYLLGFESEEAMAGEISLADVTKRQQVKIEEMMLHLIELSDQVQALKQENDKLKKSK